MRKAGAKEGSIGSKGAVDVNQSPVSVAVTGRQSDLMIKFCTCTGRSLSPSLCNLNNTDISMTCKGCTGESTTDRGGPSCSRKLGSMGLELPRPIDPGVRWKTVNRRQRTARRARTSFSGEDRMKDEIRSFYAFGNEMAQEDAPVSESEKLGVSILGRRFSDPMESVPIKKRRFHMDCSPSPPPTPLLVDPYEKILSSSSGGIPSYEKHLKVKMLGGECKEENKGPFDTDDFSGISILAAAACESAMDGDILNGACSKLAHPPEERKLENTMNSTELSLQHGMKRDKLKILEASHCIHDKPLESSNSPPDMKPLFVTTLISSENLVESASAPNVNCSLYSALSSANKTEIASDAKPSSVAMPNSSGNPDKSVGCSQDAVVQTKHANDTHDSRLHWDLNVAMEAWDTNCGDDDDRIDPTVAAVSDRNDAGNDMNKPQTSHDLFDSTDAGDALDLSVDKVHKVDVPKDVNTKDEGDSPVDSSSHPLHHQSSQNSQLLKSDSIGNDTSAETINLPDQQKIRFHSVMESLLGSNPEPVLITEHFPLTANVEKIDCSHPLPVGCEALSHMSSADGHVGGNSIQTSELGSTVKPFASRLVSEESTNLPTVTAFHKLEEASEQSISELKNKELLDVDSGTSKRDQSVSKKGEHGTDVYTKSIDPENLTHPEDNPGSSVCDMAHVHEEDGADAVINSEDCLITCANSSSAETYYVSGAAPQALGLHLECNKPGVKDAGSIVDSQAAARSYQNGYENKLGKVALDICLEHCYETDTSHISKNLAGIGKVDVEEDDSQYEDGELRESGDLYWVDDGYEEVKRADWHYHVSDYKNEAATPDIPPLPVDSVSKNVGVPAAGYNGTQSRKEDDAISPVSSKRSWSTNCLDGGFTAAGKALSIHSRVTGDTQMYEINPGRVTVKSAATVSQPERCNDGLGDDLLSITMKNTGWDMLPENQRHSRRDPRNGADSSKWCVLSSLDAAGGDESLQKMGLSNRDVQRVERPRSFDRPHRNELSRSDDGYGSGSKAERTIDSHKSHGIYDASRHIQVGSWGEQWVENSKHPRSTRRKSSENYNYCLSGPRNAAEAAVAKMENNGFVVARDGTLVRAVDAANAGHMARRMRNTSSYRALSGQGSPIDRDGACGLSRGPAHAREASPERHFGASSSQSGRYGLEMEKDHTTDGNLSSVRCSLSSRQRGIPTGRASLNLLRAHSRSPSGSRSRSPHDWASPRNRRKIMANGASTLRRHSRSPPSHTTKVRMGRMTSPQRQPGYDDRAMRYSPLSRNHNYSQHASAWVDGRNSSAVDLSDQNKRYSRRSSPLRITSRNDRFDVTDSQGRSRSGEFYRSTQGRLPYGYRGNKHDGNRDDKREYADRYESHSVKPCDRNGAVKQFRNNTGDKFRTRISAPRSPELQRRVSPRRFDSFGR